MSPRWFASLLVIAIAGGCGKKEEPKPPVSEGVPVSGAPADAQQLGSEMFELIDRIADYRSSHEGRPPKSLRQLGVDSLTPNTIRRLAIQGRTFTGDRRVPAPGRPRGAELQRRRGRARAGRTQ